MRYSRWYTFPVCLCVGLGACQGPAADNIGGSNLGDGAFALTNTVPSSEDPSGLLTGQGLKLSTQGPSQQLLPNTVYQVGVENTSTGDDLTPGSVEIMTTRNRELPPYSLLFDLGHFDSISPNDNLRVTITHPDEGTALSQNIRFSGIRLPGWDVQSVSAPNVVACDAEGRPANAFAVGGQDPGEVTGEVYVRGDGFPETLRGAQIDLYIVRAGDDWLHQDIPQVGEEGYVRGPITVTVGQDGSLPPIATGFVPDTGVVGIYDVLADTDQNGVMDWQLGVKDGGDGVGEQVGFTVQYSQAWWRARRERHVLVNLAYNSPDRQGGEWTNVYGPEEDIYTYVNPPVMHQYHFGVRKWIVLHQDFDAFWNNPEREVNGCVPFEEFAVSGLALPVQRGCTNTPPVRVPPLSDLVELGVDVSNTVIQLRGQAMMAFDVVFDRNEDGCYEPGVDLLDIVGDDTVTGDLITPEQLDQVEPALRAGFFVIQP